jgi:hypothetical protein
MSEATKDKQVSGVTKNKISVCRLLFFLDGGKVGNEVAVNQFSLSGKFIARHESVADAARKVGIADSNISRCARGDRPTAGGFIWRYAREFLDYELEQDKDGNYISAYPDKNNHCIDRTRYAHNLVWRRRGQ